MPNFFLNYVFGQIKKKFDQKFKKKFVYVYCFFWYHWIVLDKLDIKYFIKTCKIIYRLSSLHFSSLFSARFAGKRDGKLSDKYDKMAFILIKP